MESVAPNRLFFSLTGPFVPYVRMTQRSKFANPAARRYLDSKSILAAQFRVQMIQHDWTTIPRGRPLSILIRIDVTRRLHCSDLDNQVKALLDAAQGVVFDDDRWVDVIKAHRRLDTEADSILMIVRERG